MSHYVMSTVLFTLTGLLNSRQPGCSIYFFLFHLHQHIISTDEDPGLRIESFAVINLRGVSTNKTIIFGTLFWNDIKWSAHGVLEQCLVYYICVQPCITIFISYSHNKSYDDLLFQLLFVYLSMLLQRFYSLIMPNPGVQIAYNKYMSIYSG
jgi:hypothetical protein